MIFSMTHIINSNVKNTHCVFCFKETETEYMDAHNNEGCIVFAIQICKDCAKDLKRGINTLFDEEGLE